MRPSSRPERAARGRIRLRFPAPSAPLIRLGQRTFPGSLSCVGSSKFARARALGSAALAGLELHWRPCLENLDLDDDSDFCWPSENGRSRPQPEIGSCTAT